MKAIEIRGKRGDSTIRVGERLKSLPKYVDTERVVVITDENVSRHYAKDFPYREVIEIRAGEEAKNLGTVQTLYGELLKREVDRSTFIVGIGGGVVSDITGFVASTYLRGLRFGFVSSTLLSQVDASVGGKNGVNFGGYKNMVGLINQPEFVICDLHLLKTLPHEEILCGLAEVVKHAAIGDAELFSYLEEHALEALALNTPVMEKLVHDSVLIKSSIVNRDEADTGERRKLNFGHTFAHAIEKTEGRPHGEAVSLGMVAASALSVRMGHLTNEEMQRVVTLLKKLGLPSRLQFDAKEIFDAVRKDKKREGGHIHFVLLKSIGDAFVEQIPMEELEPFCAHLNNIMAR